MRRSQLSKIVVIFLLLGLVPIQALALESDNIFGEWEIRSPLPTTNDLYALTYGGDQYVAVGEEGTIVTSMGGEQWKPQRSNTDDRLIGITYGLTDPVQGRGLYVAVGADSDIVTSPDGVHWTVQQAVYENVRYNDIAFGAGKFVAVGGDRDVGRNMNILISEDGNNWTAQPTGSMSGGEQYHELYSVTYADGTFVAVGVEYNMTVTFGIVLTSPDGVHWQEKWRGTNSYTYPMNVPMSVAYGNNTFVATGTDGILLTSSDQGESWEEGAALAYYNLNTIIHGHDGFVAMGSSNDIFTSSDLMNWTKLEDAMPGGIQDLIFRDGKYIAVGYSGALFASVDLQNWTSKIVGTTRDLFGVAYGKDTFVAVGDYGTIITSQTGETWEDQNPNRTTTSQILYDVVFGNGRFVAAGAYGTIVTSDNGIDWHALDEISSDYYFRGALYSNDMYYGVGSKRIDIGNDTIYSGVILASTDGTTWNEIYSGSDDGINELFQLSYGNNTLVAVGYDEELDDSVILALQFNGSAWTSTRTILSFYSVVFAEDTFVGAGYSGSVYTSTDGIDWVEQSTESDYSLYKLIYANGYFVVVGNDGVVSVSKNGRDWEEISNFDFYPSLYGAAYGKQSLVVVGSYGRILQVPWTVLLEQVAKPIATPAGGEVQAGTQVTLRTVTDGATIYYTMDGSTPSNKSIEYSTPIKVTAAMTIKAIAVKGGMADSEVIEEHYTLRSQNSNDGSGGGGGGWTGSNSGHVTSSNGTVTIPVGSSGEVSLGGEIVIKASVGAAEQELRITIEKLIDSSGLLTDQQTLVSHVYEVLKNFSGNFKKSVTLSIKFDPTKVGKNQKVAIFYYDEDKKTWMEVGGTVKGEWITTEVDHFTKFAVLAVDQALSFTDIAGHWGESSIIRAATQKLVSGYLDGTFKPNNPVTRAEFTVMLMGALKLDGTGAALHFTDQAKIGDWAKRSVALAVQAGIVNGYEDGSFRPDARITRAEMASMLAKALKVSLDANATTSFSDNEDIPKWAKGAVEAIRKLGIISGRGGNKFVPNDTATRTEAVVMLLRMLEYKYNR